MIARFFKPLGIATMVASATIAASPMVRASTETPSLSTLYAGQPESWPRPLLKPNAVFTEFAPLPTLPAPTDREKSLAAIGQRLFDDPSLSRSNQIACASCHSTELGLSDGLRTSFGHDRQRGRRNSQSLLTVAWMTPLFWDGRSSTLEEQAVHPLIDVKEMANSIRKVEQRVNRNQFYSDAFSTLIGSRWIAMSDIGDALAAHQRTFKPPRSKWSRFIGGDRRAFNEQELEGLHLFRTKGGCANCHNGPLLSDQKFHNLGLSFYGRRLEDLGRYEVTGDAADVGKFRTPSLLGASRSAPYMHVGLFRTLENVVTFYNSGGGRDRLKEGSKVPPPQPDPLIAPLELTRAERDALVAFLETL